MKIDLNLDAQNFTSRCVTALSKIIKKTRMGTLHEISNDFHQSVSVEVSEKIIQRQLLNWGITSALLQKQTHKKGVGELNHQKEASPIPQRQNPPDCTWSLEKVDI